MLVILNLFFFNELVRRLQEIGKRKICLPMLKNADKSVPRRYFGAELRDLKTFVGLTKK